MKSKLSKWGNSYAVRLPIELVEALDISENTELSITRTEEGVLLKRPSNDELLDKLTAHMQPRQEEDWGLPRGKEVW